MSLLPRKERLFQALLEHLSDSIYFKDLNSRFIFCNESLAHMLGANSSADVLGKTDADYFGPDHAVRARKDELSIIRKGIKIENQTERVDFPDGSVRWHFTSKAPFRDENGDVAGIVGISKDMTDLKDTQDRLMRAQQKISEDSRNAGRAEIASIVIHNVGNMLNSVNITASMIDKLSTQYEELDLSQLSKSIRGQIESPTMDPKDYLSKIEQYISLASERSEKGYLDFRAEVENLKEDVSRIQKIILVQQDLVSHLCEGQFRSWKEVIEDALEINKVALERHQVICRLEFSADEDILIPEFQVLQILLNFISNSKYSFDSITRKQRSMIVRAEMVDQAIHLSVEDNGVGISKEELDQVFELGFTTREEGHGIGLHGSRMAAKEISASIRVQSDGIGQGAIATLSIPLAQCRRLNESS